MVKNPSTCQCRRHWFNPWSRKIPHASEQLSPYIVAAEPVPLSPGAATTKIMRKSSPKAWAQDQERTGERTVWGSISIPLDHRVLVSCKSLQSRWLGLLTLFRALCTWPLLPESTLHFLKLPELFQGSSFSI